MNGQTAFITFELPFSSTHGGQFSIFLAHGGSPDRIRSCLRAACRGRRSIVFSRFWTYVPNVVKHLLMNALDSVEIEPTNICTRTKFDYRYRLWIDDRDIPMIEFESKDGHRDVVSQPLFQFIGVEGRSGKHRGRPSPHPHLKKTPVPDYIDPVTREAVYLPKGALTSEEFNRLLKLRDHQAVRPLTYREEQEYRAIQEKIGKPIPTQPVPMTKAERERLAELSVKNMRNMYRGHQNTLDEMEEFEFNQLTKKEAAWNEWKNPDEYRGRYTDVGPRKIRKISK